MPFYLNEDKLRRAEIFAFTNGLRLHFDSIRLFEAKSYPSSYFLSILALEEFGKQRLIDEIIFRYNEHRNEFESKEAFKKWCKLYEQVFLNHSVKQGFAIRDDFPLNKYNSRVQKKYFNEVFNKKNGRSVFDFGKLRSVYVGFQNNSLQGKIQKPTDFVKRDKTKKQITAMNDYLINYIIFVRKEIWQLDNPDLTRKLNIKLLNKLDSSWKYKHFDTKVMMKVFFS